MSIKGTNLLKLNRATVREALEYWLNTDILQGGEHVKVEAAFEDGDYLLVHIAPQLKEAKSK